MGPQTHNICAAAKEKFLKGALLCAEWCLAIFLCVFWSILSLWLRAKRSLIFVMIVSLPSNKSIKSKIELTYIHILVAQSVKNPPAMQEMGFNP